MPIYEYRCDACEGLYEVFQKMSDDPLETCERCGGRLRKVLHPVAIHFKGSGFYTTDYGRGSRARPPKESADTTSGADGGPEAGAAKPAKPASAEAGGGPAGAAVKARTPASS